MLDLKTRGLVYELQICDACRIATFLGALILFGVGWDYTDVRNHTNYLLKLWCVFTGLVFVLYIGSYYKWLTASNVFVVVFGRLTWMGGFVYWLSYFNHHSNRS